MVSFAVQKFLSLLQSYMLIFAFVDGTFDVCFVWFLIAVGCVCARSFLSLYLSLGMCGDFIIPLYM